MSHAKMSLVFLALLTACGPAGTLRETKMLGPVDVLVTTADVRTTLSVQRYADDGVKLKGQRIVCTEPSPDVVKIFSDARQIGAGFSVSGLPSGISPEVAFAISSANAQAAAQLGERLATVQLLRDGTFRACEAYANGAINEAAYAALLSRYDDTMVTMLLGEIAGGAFGRELATLSSTSGGSASGSTDRDQSSDQTLTRERTSDSTVIRDLADRAERSEAAVEQAVADLADEAASGTASRETVRRLEDRLNQRVTESRELNTTLKLVIEADAESNATATANSGIGKVSGTANAEVAGQLREMARKYIENINTDALSLACLVELSRFKASGDTNTSMLAELCQTQVLALVGAQQHEVLMSLKRRAALNEFNEGQARNFDAMLAELTKRVEAVAALNKAFEGKAGGASDGGSPSDQVAKAAIAHAEAVKVQAGLDADVIGLANQETSLKAEIATLKGRESDLETKKEELAKDLQLKPADATLLALKQINDDALVTVAGKIVQREGLLATVTKTLGEKKTALENAKKDVVKKKTTLDTAIKGAAKKT